MSPDGSDWRSVFQCARKVSGTTDGLLHGSNWKSLQKFDRQLGSVSENNIEVSVVTVVAISTRQQISDIAL